MKPEDRQEAVRVGLQIKRFRLRAGWSQRELAERIDVSHQMIQKYESGSARLPSPRLKRLVEVFQTSHSEFLGKVPAFVAGETLSCGRVLAGQEQRLLAAFHRLSDGGQRKVVIELIETMAFRRDGSFPARDSSTK